MSTQFKEILTVLVEHEEKIDAKHVALIEQLITEESTTTIASLPTTLMLKTTDPKRTEKLMDIIGAFVYPVSNMTWDEFVKKFGKMTMTDFIKKTKIDVNQLSTSLSKTFPYINKAIVNKLA